MNFKLSDLSKKVPSKIPGHNKQSGVIIMGFANVFLKNQGGHNLLGRSLF